MSLVRSSIALITRAVAPLRSSSSSRSSLSSSLSLLPQRIYLYSSSSSASPAASSSSSRRHDESQIDIRTLNATETSMKRDEDDVQLFAQQESVGVDGDEELLEARADDNAIVFRDVPLSQVLSRKQRYGSTLHTVQEDDKIGVAMELMRALRIGAVLVRGREVDDIVGIVSTRDFVRRLVDNAAVLDGNNGLVSQFMTPSPIFVFSNEGAIACLELMQKHQIRHLPVRDPNSKRTIGVVSIGDLVRHMLEQYKEQSSHLLDFIRGKYA